MERGCDSLLMGVVYAGLYFVLAFCSVCIILYVHDAAFPQYNLWEEIHKGNVAVGLAAAGKVIGIGIIAMYAILQGDRLIWSLVWLFIGGGLQIGGLLLFELMTPKISVANELANGNKAVGLVSMAIAVGLSFLVGACIG